MKHLLITLSSSLLLMQLTAQEMTFEVRPAYARAVKISQLNNVTQLRDLVDGYPINWINSYNSVEVAVTSNGKANKTSGRNETLSTDAQNTIHKAAVGSVIEVNVRYKYMNPVTDRLEESRIHTKLTVIPDVEAAYSGGNKELNNYIRTNGINKIPENTRKRFKTTVIRFTINEQGGVSDARIDQSCGDPFIDMQLLETINKMPRWQAAQNADGTKAKQDFVLSVGQENGDGC